MSIMFMSDTVATVPYLNKLEETKAQPESVQFWGNRLFAY